MIIANQTNVLSKETTTKDFAEIKPLMGGREAAIEASRCLYCYDAPCIKACPTSVDVPEFIKRIATGNLKGSARVILESNILGLSCGKVCPTEVLCEGACVYNNDKQKPIEIGRLQRYAVEHVIKNDIKLFQPGKYTGKKIAVIGGGPAGISCAAELRKFGHSVTVYDANNESGGLTRYGIAPYKLTVLDWDDELAYINSLGISFMNGKYVGNDIQFSDLEKEYDAIFISVGLGKTRQLGVLGEDLNGVRNAIDFIRELHTTTIHDVKVGRNVAVIGSGNTAIDAATEAKRLGAEQVFILYRRSVFEKSCHESEYELAKKDGIVFYWHTMPVRITGEKYVAGIVCQKTKPAKAMKAVKGKVEIVPNSEWTLDVDMVINATGQEKQESWLSKISGLTLNNGCVVVNQETGRTTNKKYFAGGDCVNGGKEVVNAVSDGKRAAFGIHKFIMGIS